MNKINRYNMNIEEYHKEFDLEKENKNQIEMDARQKKINTEIRTPSDDTIIVANGLIPTEMKRKSDLNPSTDNAKESAQTEKKSSTNNPFLKFINRLLSFFYYIKFW